MRHVFVDEHALDELCVRKRAANLAIDFDEVEKDVASLEVCDGQDGIDGDLGKLLVLFRDASVYMSIGAIP